MAYGGTTIAMLVPAIVTEGLGRTWSDHGQLNCGDSGEWLPGVLLVNDAGGCVGFLFCEINTRCSTFSRDELRRMQTGRPARHSLPGLMKDPDRLLSVVLFCNLTANLMYFAISLITARRLVTAGFSSVAATLSVIGFFGLVFFGEVAPKTLAVRLQNKTTDSKRSGSFISPAARH